MAVPCPCGVHHAVHECSRATGRKRWVLSVPPWVLWTEGMAREAHRPRLGLKLFASEDAAWDFQAVLRGAYALDARASATAGALLPAPKPRARRRVEMAAAPTAAPVAAEDDWIELDGGAGGGFDAPDEDEAGPSTAPPPRKRAKTDTAKPRASWGVDPLVPQSQPEVEEMTQEATQEGLAARYVGTRVVFNGQAGTIKGLEPHLEYEFLFNTRFDDGSYEDIELRDIEEAAEAAAAAGIHPAAVAAKPAAMSAPRQQQRPPVDDDVIVIDDDDEEEQVVDDAAAVVTLGDDDDEAPRTQRGRRASAPTPAPPAPAPRRFRKATTPAKRPRRSYAEEEADADDIDASVPQTQPAAPVLELAAVSQSMLVRLSSAITKKLGSGVGPFGKLSTSEGAQLEDLLMEVDKRMLSAYVRFEAHQDDKRLCAEWRALLSTAS